MKLYSSVLCLALGSWIVCSSLPLNAQAPAPGTTPAAQGSLTFVDGVAEQENPVTHGPVLLTQLKKTDFRLFDNRKEVPIQSFSVGADTRPIVLWLIAQCSTGIPADWGSNFIKGKTEALKPALMHLNRRDLVGVAHWCDDGQAKVDAAPGTDVDAALKALDQALDIRVANANDRAGEQSMLHMVRMVDDSTRSAKPASQSGPAADQAYIPVFLFLYGDQSGTDSREANSIMENVLETSGIVYGLSVIEIKHDVLEDVGSGQTFNQAHYYSRVTGGQYYSTSQPQLYAPTIDYIIAQLHARYTLGFQPTKLDAKPHDLQVELTKDAQSRFPKTTLRFRAEYFPLPPKQ